MGMKTEKIKEILYRSCFTYQTTKVVNIESKDIGFLYNVLQTSLFVMIIVWIFILNNGYQFEERNPRASSTSKIKGVAYTKSVDPRVGKRIWDSSDLQGNPAGDGAFFIATNIIITHEQAQSICSEKGVGEATCQKDEDCKPKFQPYHLGHGISTGTCNTTVGTCEVIAWCPVEDDSPAENGTLKHTNDFTVFVKNNVYFPYYHKKRSNLIESLNKSYTKSCRYHPIEHPHCPIFRLADIVGMSVTKSANTRSENDEHFESMTLHGGIVAISINWDCNFDYDATKCKPVYKFDRLDSYEGNGISIGYNFRYKTDYVAEGVVKRSLVKAYGILFVIQTEAVARAFHFKTFFLNVGSCLGVLGLASFITDVVLLHIHRKRNFFAKKKTDGTKPTIKSLMRDLDKLRSNKGDKEQKGPAENIIE